ncbi:hypothetical protein [Serratia marcescens]|uniref:hypothetical protein n=1 Tax=Serratia marcescens TaxID=615 RepID=UPI003513C0B1
MDKLSELKDALEFLETTEFDGEWGSALVGGESGKNYHAVINANDVVVRTADDSRHTSWLCDYLEAVSPVKIRALLAELEAKDKQNKLLIREIEHGKKLRVNMQNNADSLSERIAELERANQSQDDHINQQQDRIESLEKKNGDLGRSLVAAEKRLATPVRLPNKNDDEFWFDGVFQVAKFDRAVERAISAAGFKFAGDEQ